jgi:hypothetical protein
MFHHLDQFKRTYNTNNNNNNNKYLFIIDNDGPPVMAPVAVVALLKLPLPYIDPLGVWPLSMLFIPSRRGGGCHTEERIFDHCVIVVRIFQS